jgi:hypothetical protein
VRDGEKRKGLPKVLLGGHQITIKIKSPPFNRRLVWRDTAMTCNVGGIERPIRMVLGLMFIALGAFAALPPAGMWISYAVGAIALITGMVGFCPAWNLLGINTCPAKPK